MSKSDCRPAFPGYFINNAGHNAMAPDGQLVAPGDAIHMTGMTLRQWYAGQALQGYLASCKDTGPSASQVARECWRLADTMIAAENESTE